MLGPGGAWVEDPTPVLLSADVVVVQAGQGSVADVAACRRPAVVVPAERPHDEQVTTASVLAGDEWPTVVLDTFPETGWSEVLERAASLDGTRWESWYDGRSVERFAAVLSRTGCDDRRRTA